MTTNEAINYIENFTWGKTKLGLSRTKALLASIGNPEKKLKFVHVAGSNGKGSTCAFISSILAVAGYKVGFYSSPYLVDFCERIQILSACGSQSYLDCESTPSGLRDCLKCESTHPSLAAPSAPEPVVSDRSSQCSLVDGVDSQSQEVSQRKHKAIRGENISYEALARITQKIKLAADKLDDHPTQFEIITAIGFEYFMEQGCDIVVLEVGMGGEFDATNVIDAPCVSVITNIGLEHTEYLGSTIEEIASAKGGIIKTGSLAVSYDGCESANAVIERICKEKNVPLTFADFSKIEKVSASLDGQKFTYKGNEYETRLLGRHQLYNAAVAIEAANALISRGYAITQENIAQGIGDAVWHGRFEVLSKNPLFILDGGHNPQCAAALVKTLDSLFPSKKFIFVTGILADKNYEKVFDIISPYAAEFICVTPNSPRALPAKDLAKYLLSRGLEAKACDSVDEGIEEALGLVSDVSSDGESVVDESLCAASIDDAGVVAFGSLYMAGAVLRHFRKL